jgi:hypothetical protein
LRLHRQTCSPCSVILSGHPWRTAPHNGLSFTADNEPFPVKSLCSSPK